MVGLAGLAWLDLADLACLGWLVGKKNQNLADTLRKKKWAPTKKLRLSKMSEIVLKHLRCIPIPSRTNFRLFFNVFLPTFVSEKRDGNPKTI